MPGYHEILIIAVVGLLVILLPRMIDPRKPALKLVQPKNKLSGRWRLAIAVSIIYPLGVTAILQPWKNDPYSSLYIGLGPVLLGWLIFWVLMGFKVR